MPDLDDQTYRSIASLMHSAVGLSFPDSKKALVSSRLTSRIQRLGLGGFDDYLDLIAGHHGSGEFQVAVDLLTTNETYFFREPAHFELLKRELSAWPLCKLSIWSAASSFGDEAYSTAMLLSDMQRHGQIGRDWSILGTDISDRVLQSARAAIFPEERLRHVKPSHLKSYCLRGEGPCEGLVQMQECLTDRVRFGRLNLCEPFDLPLGLFDVIFLRNVLIYFDARTKREVLDRVLTQLRPGGLFIIGTADGRAVCQTPLQYIAPGAYRKA